MKKTLLLLLTSIFLLTHNSSAQDPTFGTLLTTKIKLADLKQACYSGDADAIRSAATKKQPIVSQEEAFKFFNKIINPGVGTTHANIVTIGLTTDEMKDYATNKRKTLIFLLHPIDLSKFEQNANNTRKAELVISYNTNNTNKATYKTAIADLELLAGKYLTNLKPGALSIPVGGGSAVALTLDQQGKNAEFYNAVQTQIITLKRRIEEIDEQNKKYLEEYNNLFNQYVEDKDVKTFMIHQAKVVPTYEQSEYLSEIDDFLIVTLGGQKDLAKLAVEVTKKTNAFTSSINAGTEIISDVTGIRLGKIQGNMPTSLSSPPEPEIPINFIRLVRGRLKSPYELKLKIPDQDTSPTYTVHEINRFLLTFGFSTKYIQPRSFSASGNSVTVIEPDKDLQNTIRGDLFVMLDWSPWGRDLDKLLENDLKIRRIEKLSFALGIKLSKDPLQSIFLGPAYNFGNGVRLFAGPYLNTIPKEGATLTVGTISASQDYLLKNIDREYKINFMVGLSFSPSTIKSIIGSDKKE